MGTVTLILQHIYISFKGEIVLRKFNFDEFLWLIVIILIDLGLIYLIATGKAELYIGKKMIKYIYISIFILGVICILQISNVFTQLPLIILK